jgi:molecular chaperone DnaK (HSP70)
MAADLTKCVLSTAPASLLTYHHASVDVDARVTRGRFETLIGPMLAETDALLNAVLAKAGVVAEDVGEVVTTGGSSAIPAFRALLARRFPASRVRDAAAFTSVASGLAMPGAQEAARAST